MNHADCRRRAGFAVVFCVLLSGVIVGCAKTQLMPTPNLYVNCGTDPFKDVPVELRSNTVDVLYFTDRVPEGENAEGVKYGYGRSRSEAFGISQVKFGDNVSWEQLVTASTTRNRKIDLSVTVPRTTEIGRFEPTPPELLENVTPESSEAAERATEQKFKSTLSSMMKKTPVKEVYLYVHGVFSPHTDCVYRAAEAWHFNGRQGVPIAYSWPAGSPGIRAYMYDRESSEFTVYHLKEALKLLASCPDVEKVNIFSHSRGTDVVSSALRELHIEYAAAGKSPGKELKLGTVVLAAPDMDLGVTIQRMATARVGLDPERLAIYVNHTDKLLKLSNWLFDGSSRLGDMNASMFKPAELEAMRKGQSPQVINCKIKDAGSFDHYYFDANPAVSSDLVLLMRYKLAPDAPGRPLGNDHGFWIVDDKYPVPAHLPAAAEKEK